MMKRFFVSVVLMALAIGSFAQTREEIYNDIMDGRVLKAQKDLESALSKDPANLEYNYWLGQAYLVQGLKTKAREHYAKAMEVTKQAPLMMVAMGHVELLDGKAAEAKAHFEAAIAATATKKNKKYGDPAILNAIVRANSDGGSNTGDIDYAIAKAAQSEELMGATPDMFTSLGVIYLKRGGEFGGQAKRAFEKALDINPNFAPAYFRVGRIFESQRNQELFMQYYEKAINANPRFAPAYIELYDHWADRDVNKAKQYLDFYIANADKNRETDYFYADYLFRAGQYEESLKKGQEIEAALGEEKFPKVYKLYAFNYDRLKDSVKAMNFMEKFVNESDPEALSGDDYAKMAAAYLKVPGNVEKAEAAAEKAIALDTSIRGRVEIMDNIANAYAAQQDWVGQYKWLSRKNALKPDNSARNFFFLADAAHKAKDYEAAQKVASEYIKTYPDQSQGYYLKWRSAVAADPDTSKGTAIAAVDEYTQFLMGDTVKNKSRIITNHGYKIYFYLVKVQNYEKALESANAILALDPENNYGKMAKSEAERLIKAKGTSKTGGQSPSQGTGATAGGGGKGK